MEGAIRSGERAARLLHDQVCLLLKPILTSALDRNPAKLQKMS
jgi:hypothetical protein